MNKEESEAFNTILLQLDEMEDIVVELLQEQKKKKYVGKKAVGKANNALPEHKRT